MKHLLILLFLLPMFVIGQERQQKMNLRNYGSVAPRVNTQPAPSYQQPRIQPGRDNSYLESQQKQSYRQQRNYQREEDRFHSGGNRYHYYNYWRYDPYWNWGWNRWYGWGAPYSYHYWYPDFYFDTWGYRQPMRVYVQESGKIDTIRGIKQNYTIGIQANQSELGGFFVVGRKTFFIAEYQHRYQKDRSVFYSELTRDVVIPWADRRDDDIKKGGTLFLGLGQKFGRTGIFGALGIVNERNRYQYYDEMFILSNNGYYSFPNYKDTYLAMKLGILQDIKSATIKADYEPTRNLVTVGLGVNF